MRLAAASVVRDECDIIESFIRHNAAFIDAFYVLDNSSTDTTPAILRNLAAEGLPVVVVPDEDGYFYQARMSLKLTRRALADERWDFLFPLDCDEFIQVPDRQFLESTLAGLDGDMLGYSNYVQYIPKGDDDYGERDVVRRIVHKAEVRPKLIGKVVVPGRIAAHPEFSITEGNHSALIAGEPIAGRRIEKLDLAHYPVRSIEQFVSSIIVSRLAWISRTDYDPKWSQHVRTFYENLRIDPEPTLATLTEAMDHYIESYCENGPPDSVEIVREPLKAAYEQLRYADLIDVKVLPRVMGMAEGLVNKLHQARSSHAMVLTPGAPSPPSPAVPDSTPEHWSVIGHWDDVSDWRIRNLRAEPATEGMGAAFIRLIEDQQDSWRNIQVEVNLERGRPVKIAAEFRFDTPERQAVVIMAAGAERVAGKLDPRTRRTTLFARRGAAGSKCLATPLENNWWRLELTGTLSAQSSQETSSIIIALTKDGFREDYPGDGQSGVSVRSVTAMRS